ncbi:MAG: ABC transporter permease [Firmicutes bacterium]|nr:ABC transporter permease [Bacillota bacterium]
MRAIYKNELRSYATNVTAYVFGAFILLFAGIYTFVYNLGHQVVNFEYVPGSMPYIFLVAVPILTMKVIAEERKQRTDQLLYSLPVSMTKIITGKYLAMLTVFAVPNLIICTYPLILKQYGHVNLLTSYSSMLGFFCLGAALMAVGMFISSLTESQPVAAGICFITMLVNYYLSSLMSFVSGTAKASMQALVVSALVIGALIYIMTKSAEAALGVAVVLDAIIVITYRMDSSKYEGLMAKVIDKLCLFDRFHSFYEGRFDLTVLIFYATVIGVFLFLTVQSMEKRRWS